MTQTAEEVEAIKANLKPGETVGLKSDDGKRNLVLFPWEALGGTSLVLEGRNQWYVEALAREELEFVLEEMLQDGFTSIDGITEVMEFGAIKYLPNSWKKVRPGIRYVSGAIRHLVAISNGEEIDPESGLPHRHHCGCCVIFAKWQKDQGYNLWEADAG